jgi:hypothetical protein
VDAELRAIIRAGFVDQTTLPEIPPAPEPTAPADPSGGRRHNPRREMRRPTVTEEEPT